MLSFDPVKKAILAGLGALSYTQEKVQQIVDDLAERGEITREQAAKVLKEFAGRISTEREAVCEKIASEVREFVDKAPIVTRGEVEGLRAEIATLRAELERLREGRAGGPPASAPPAEPGASGP